MHIHIADQYHTGSSFIHRLDPRVKVGFALLFILTTSLLPFGAFQAYALLFLTVMAGAIFSGVGAGYILKRAFIALPFAMAAISLPFTIPGQTLFTFPVLGGIDVSLEGTIRFVSILIKSWVSVQVAILMVTVTPFPDLLAGLRGLHIPQPLISIVSFMYRYLFVLSDEVLRLLRARSSRSASLPNQRSGGSIIWRGKVAGRMVGSLMLRSFERSERIYNAMASRGYQGEFRTFSHPKLRTADYIFIITGFLYLGAILAASFL